MKRLRIRFGLALVLALFIGLALWSVFLISGQKMQRDDVREAVLRYILPPQGTAYLSVGHTSFPNNGWWRLSRWLLRLPEPPDREDTDPSDAFLRRFAGCKLVLKKASKTQLWISDGLVDKQTGKPAALYFAHIQRQISETEYEVVGGYYCGFMDAESCMYDVVRENGHWHITSAESCVEH